jgi:LmbE family N-acetylglucosaminyl deacetylase
MRAASGFKKGVLRWRQFGLILLILLSFILGPALFSKNSPPLSPSRFPLLPLHGHSRLLVLAPHTDDETLSSAGLMLAAERAGIEVRVVIATNGDGSRSTEVGSFHRILPRSQDYIRMGDIRQQESLAALKVLGVRADQVYFLSYPDRGSAALWGDHWSESSPYRSPFSGVDHSPYQITYNPHSVYAGQDYLADLTSILASYRPDLIIYPHPDDLHPDHWGLNVFTRLAITLLNHRDPTFQPAQYTYLVHRYDFPTILGYQPQDGLVPPPALYPLDPNWLRWDLTPEDIVLKTRAVREYRSQMPTLGRLLESFIRQNELFAPVFDADLQVVEWGNATDPASWVNEAGRPVQVVQLEPGHDTIVRNALPSSTLIALYVARDEANLLWMCVQAEVPTSTEVTYSLHLKALTSTGVQDYQVRSSNLKAGRHKAQRSGVYVCDRVALSALGNPWAIYIGADSEGPGNLLLDRVGWQMLDIYLPGTS